MVVFSFTLRCQRGRARGGRTTYFAPCTPHFLRLRNNFRHPGHFLLRVQPVFPHAAGADEPIRKTPRAAVHRPGGEYSERGEQCVGRGDDRSASWSPAEAGFPGIPRLCQLAGVLLYVAGNFFNDWMDREWDGETPPGTGAATRVVFTGSLSDTGAWMHGRRRGLGVCSRMGKAV